MGKKKNVFFLLSYIFLRENRYLPAISNNVIFNALLPNYSLQLFYVQINVAVVIIIVMSR